MLESKKKNDNVNLVRYCDVLHQTYEICKKVVFIQAPQFLFDTMNVDVIRNRGYYAFPPTGLQCLIKSLTGRDIEANLFDLNFFLLQKIINDTGYAYSKNWLQLVDDYLDKTNPSIVGVTSLTVYADLFGKFHPLSLILDHLMRKKKYVVITGGPIASNEIHQYLTKKLCHFIIEGEGEDKLNYLFDILFNENDYPAVTKIYFVYDDVVKETFGKTESHSPKGNLIDTYKQIPIEEYCKVGCLNPFSRMSGLDNIYSVFQLNRGCRSNCKFCGVRSFMGKGIRTFPVEDVINEITYLVEKRGVRHFDVLDDDFLATEEPVKRLLSSIIDLRKKYKITWSASNGLIAGSITQELLDLMRESGCNGFRIGFESGDINMLRKMRKPGNPMMFQKVANMLQNYPEFFVGGNFIIGLFGEETFEQMLHTFTFSSLLNLDWAAFTLFQITSKQNKISENLKNNVSQARDFIPTKNSPSRIFKNDRNMTIGTDIFSFPHDKIPCQNQLQNIWFTFNFFSNYINNKNLKPGGNPKKFVSWVEALQISYPENPYMYYFSALGRVLLGDIPLAKTNILKSKTIVEKSENWMYKFNKFGINTLLNITPHSPNDVYEILDSLKEPYKPYMRLYDAKN